MSMFPPDFQKYEPFKVRAVIEKSDSVRALFTDEINKLPTLSHTKNLGQVLENLEYPIVEPFGNIEHLYAPSEQASPELKDALEKNRIEIAPASHTVDLIKLAEHEGQKIAGNIATTLDEYDYYNVELGLNIILGQGYKLKKLRFTIEIFGDNNISADVVAYDTFPDDQVKRITILSGEISLGVNEILELVGGTIGVPLDRLLKITVNPWKFNWGYDIIEIQNSEGLTHTPEWLLKHDNIYKGFKPTLVIKKRKHIKKILMKVKVIYELEVPKDHWLQLRHVKYYESDFKEVAVL